MEHEGIGTGVTVITDREDRSEALQLAVRHKTRDTTLEDTMIAAKIYFEFLQGKDSKK